MQRKIMAIINITPDSFWNGSRSFDDTQIERSILKALEEGADILDLGGYSTRPGADDIPAEQEFERLERAMKIRARIAPQIPVSIDTFRSEIVTKLYDNWGTLTVNDISAGELDSQMIPTVAKLKLPYIAMHSRGNPQTMQQMTQYEGGITRQVCDFLVRKAEQCRQEGIEDLTLDPGFGFAKTVEQNFELLAGMHQICQLGYPVLAGVSRKSMIWRTLNIAPEQALNGTTALHWEALRQGAQIIRCHDVKYALETLKLFLTFERNS